MTAAAAPIGGRPTRAGGVPWRALLRMAWRDATRRKGRTLLVLLLIALPVGALVVGDVLVRSGQLTGAEAATLELGQVADARLSVGLDGKGGASLPASWPTGWKVAVAQHGFDGLVKLGAKYRSADIVAADLADPLLRGVYDVVHGRAPAAADEAAVSIEVARVFGVHIGDTVTVRRTNTTYRVVATFQRPNETGYPAIAIRDAGSLRLSTAEGYAKAPGAFSADQLPADIRDMVVTRAQVAQNHDRNLSLRLAALYTTGTIALFVLGIVISAAYAAGARRQLRTLGLAGANGATPRQLAGVVVAQGVVGGILGVLGGAAVGAAGLAAVAPHLDRFIGHVVPGLQFAPVDLVAVAGLGVLTAASAAWVPAHGLARVPLLAALGGRRPLARVPSRTPILGLVSFAVGVVLLGYTVTQQNSALGDWFRKSGSAVFILLGAVLCMPWLMSRFESLAARLRGSSRLAARSVARHRSRTGPIAAAISVAVGAAVLLASFQASSNALVDSVVSRGSFPADQVLIDAGYALASGGPAVSIDRAVIARVEAIVGPSRSGQLSHVPVGGPDLAGPSSDRATAFGDVIVADGALLRALDVPADLIAKFEAGSAVVLGPGAVRDGTIQLTVEPAPTAAPTTSTPKVVTVAAVETPRTITLGYPSVVGSLCDPDCHQVDAPPTVVIPANASTQLGLTAITGTSVLLRTTHPLSGAQQVALDRLQRDLADEAASRLAAGDESAAPVFLEHVEPASSPSHTYELVLLGVVLVLALSVTAIGLALTRAENRSDDSTLTALGAPPRMRRRVQATQALIICLTAAVVAIPLGFVPAAVYIANRRTPFGGGAHDPVVFPWRVALGAGVVVPLLAAVLGWAVTRNPRAVELRDD